MDSSQTPNILILGGGFGGLFTALRLSEFEWPEHCQPTVTLIDQNRHFVFAPLLYELVTGELETWEITPALTDLLQPPTQFKQGAVQSVNLDQQQVSLQSGETVAYDRLVLALGGETPVEQVPGAAEHALPFRTVEDAHALQARLKVLEASEQEAIRVVVAGGGASGVELACKLADRLGDRGRIRLVERNREILKSSPSFNRQAAQAALSKRGVWVDTETSLQHIDAHEVQLTYKDQADTIPVDLVLWTVGTTLAEPIQQLGAAKSANGRLTTTQTLQLQDYPQVWTLGDLADCIDASGQNVPTTAQSALQQADCVAWNIWASLTGRPLLPFRYSHLGEMLTLGMDSAALSGFNLTLDGPMAYLARRLVYLYRMPTLEHQLKVGLNWMVKPLLDALRT